MGFFPLKYNQTKSPSLKKGGFFFIIMEKIVKIGKILKTHGFKGTLKVGFDVALSDDLQNIKTIFVNDLPYFITKIEIIPSGFAFLDLEEIDTKEKAQKICGKDLMVQKQFLSVEIEEDEFDVLIGFSAIDEKKGILGIIDDVYHTPQQVLASIILNKKEIFIPLHPDFIAKLDKKKKEIHFSLPDGLLDL